MYYVIQVAPREEQKIVRLINNAIPKELCRDCFFPMRDIRRKIRGEFTNIREVLFPGYVFVESDTPQELHEAIREIPNLTKMLGIDYDETNETFNFEELPSHEVAWLAQIISDDDRHIVPLSQVAVDVQGDVRIVSGPLMSLTEHILKFDLHKRIAKVKVEFNRKVSVIHLGIEIMKAS